MTTTIFILGLMITSILLWRRVERLETRLSRFERDGGRDVEAELVAFPTDDTSPWRRSPIKHPSEPPLAEPVPTLAPTEPPSPIPAPYEAPPIEVPATAPPAQPVAARPLGFEDLFGRTLPIWAGGATLAVAGFLIVKYSIESGLLSPAVRVFLGALFGLGLVGGAEVALRQATRIREPRVAQALAGAGIATLYGVILAAHNLYALVGPATAFVAMAAVTLAAGLLSMLFGAPSAVLGLLGGLAAPALIGSNAPNTPLLAGYLALAIGGLCALSQRQGWTWLGVLSLLGGGGWVMLLILGRLLQAPALAAPDTLALGLLVLLLTIVLPTSVLAPRRPAPLRGIAGIAGCLQVALLVASGGFGTLEWALFGSVSTALLWVASRTPGLRDLPAAGLATALLLALIWPDPSAQALALVLVGIAAIYGGPALWRVWRPEAQLLDAVQLSAIAAAVPLIPLSAFGSAIRSAAWLPYAQLALLGAAVAGGAAALGWRCATRRDDARFAILGGSAGALVIVAAFLALPLWAFAPAVGITGLALLALAGRADDDRVEQVALVAGIISLVLVATTNGAEWLRAMGYAADVTIWQSSLRWGAIAAGACGLAWRARIANASVSAATLIVPLAYIAVAQVVALPWLPLIPSLALAALALAATADPRRMATMSGAAVVTLLWTVEPLATWAFHALAALAGEPMLVSSLPEPIVALTQLAAPAVALALIVRSTVPAPVARAGTIAAAILATAAAHILWKQVFALTGQSDVVNRALAERTLWELLLTGLALAAWRLGRPRAALVAAGLALAHLGWFTLLLHNPLWTRQVAGPWLIAAHALALALLWTSTRVGVALPTWWPRVRDAVRIVLIPLVAASVLRQAFHGDILVGGGTSAEEDIARSLSGIALAVGYLRYGIARGLRDWRIASLVIMLVTVIKVFAVDAAGLGGLLRIASFAALGFSLIGVGWLYSRYLPDRG